MITKIPVFYISEQIDHLYIIGYNSAVIERYPVQRLDQALSSWEDWCFLLETFTKAEIRQFGGSAFTLEGPLTHYKDLRQHILTSSQDQDFDNLRFISDNTLIALSLEGLNAFPWTLYEWNRSSRRVFNLSEDIQFQLQNTTLSGIHWSDVRFPFDAFGMSLPSPITHPNGPSCDFITFAKLRENEQDAMMITMFPETLDRVTPLLSHKERSRMTDPMNKGRWSRAHRQTADLISKYSEIFPYIPSFALFHHQFDDAHVLDTETLMDSLDDIGRNIHAKDLGAELSDETREMKSYYFREASQLVVGFSLYLQQLPPGSSHQSEWRKLPPTPDLTAITNESQVCYVTSTHPLTKEQVRDFEGNSTNTPHEKRWHWRSGYWHRRQGEGKISNAPKVIWQPPMEIRKDRKPLDVDSVTGGAQTNV